MAYGIEIVGLIHIYGIDIVGIVGLPCFSPNCFLYSLFVVTPARLAV
jgi:hypothetical protein